MNQVIRLGLSIRNEFLAVRCFFKTVNFRKEGFLALARHIMRFQVNNLFAA